MGSTVGSDGELDKEICARIKAGWGKWKEASGVLCDRKIPEKLKGMLFAVVVRPTMLYSSQCWPVKKVHQNKLEVSQSRMLRWALALSGKISWKMNIIGRGLGLRAWNKG